MWATKIKHQMTDISLLTAKNAADYSAIRDKRTSNNQPIPSSSAYEAYLLGYGASRYGACVNEHVSVKGAAPSLHSVLPTSVSWAMSSKVWMLLSCVCACVCAKGWCWTGPRGMWCAVGSEMLVTYVGLTNLWPSFSHPSWVNHRVPLRSSGLCWTHQRGILSWEAICAARPIWAYNHVA